MRELHFATINELGQMIRRGETTPTELTEMYLKRLDSVGRRLNALVTLTAERAMREAKLAENELRAGIDRGPLHGIPYGAKDLFAAQGYPTTWGAEPFRDQIFRYDATVIQRLRDAGAVLVAKLAMIEMAGAGNEQPNATFTGPCQVPWNDEAFTGGSSSGSGAAVAGGAVAFALGSETRGSIVSPAANCGITGLRPSYGRVSRHGAMALSWTMDKVGPLARSADDCGVVMNAIAGYDLHDPTTQNQPFSYPSRFTPLRNFRFGVIESQLDGVQLPIRENFDRSLHVFKQFGRLESVTLPEFPYTEVAHTIIRAEAAAAFEEFLISGEAKQLTAPESHVNMLDALAIPASTYLRALRIRREIYQALGETMAPFDAVLFPTTSHVAPPIGSHLDTYFEGHERSLLGSATNVAGLPGIAVPNGFGERGLPTSLSIVGRPFSENVLLTIANAYQERTSWHQRHPSV